MERTPAAPSTESCLGCLPDLLKRREMTGARAPSILVTACTALAFEWGYPTVFGELILAAWGRVTWRVLLDHVLDSSPPSSVNEDKHYREE